MTIDRLQAHYGFSRTPFGRDLAPQMLHRHTSHGEAVARIGWCVTERALGVITGEVGAGKTVAVRAALAGLDPSRHTIIYLGNPAVGARGLYHGIVTALGRHTTVPQGRADPADRRGARRRARRTRPGRRARASTKPTCSAADQLEELRLLTNADMDSHQPVRMI